MLKWPDRKTVDAAFRSWAGRTGKANRSVVAVGYFGSYACGTWGVGSDLDGIILLTESALPFERRAVEFDTRGLPVGLDLLVYTVEEWARLVSRRTRFARMVRSETVWVYRKKTGEPLPGVR